MAVLKVEIPNSIRLSEEKDQEAMITQIIQVIGKALVDGGIAPSAFLIGVTEGLGLFIGLNCKPESLDYFIKQTNDLIRLTAQFGKAKRQEMQEDEAGTQKPN